MEQPLTKPNQPSSAANDNNKSAIRKRKLPTPQELIEHYESQGMERQEASVKVIQDLQNALFRLVVTSSSSSSSSSTNTNNTNTTTTTTTRKGGGGGGGGGINEGRKLDVINTRLRNIETKLDSKPGHAATFAIGLTSGALLRGIGAVFPQVLGAVGQIWNSVRATTTTTTTTTTTSHK